MNAGQTLKAKDVHIWSISLDQESRYVESMFWTLSTDERERGESYRFDNDRNRFVITRGTLRRILSEYLKSDPCRIRFLRTPYGKPFLGQMGDTIRFNVSHSRGIALFAVTRGREVGIDVEFVDKKFPIMKTAQRAFSPSKWTNLQKLGPDLQADAFFQGWTLKEAYLKAIGTGFSNPGSCGSDSEVPAASDFPPGTATFQNETDWTFAKLDVDGNYRAALAVEGKNIDIRYLRIDTGRLNHEV